MTLHDDLYGSDADDAYSDAAEPRTAGWMPRRWWTWTVALLAIGTVMLLAAGQLLSDATLGTSLRARACTTSPLGGLLLLLCATLLLTAGLIVSRLRRVGAVLAFDPGSLVLTLPVPATLVGVTLPGVLGCASAQAIAEIDLVGEALVGQGGMVLCVAAIVLVGVSIASSLHVTWLAPAASGSAPAPGLVELAVMEAAALESDATATRFRGVDPEG